MRLLLDSHSFLWWATDDRALGRTARDAIVNPTNAILLSVVSIWELSLKKFLGRLQMPDNIEEEIARRGIVALPITVAHAVAAPRLPKIHADPFDRMLIAQAQLEGLTIVTRDWEIAKYDVAILKA
jgi:PIN domain nuclease of toxin-antitoxin system